MPITVKHLKVSAIPDAGDDSLVEPSDWNADHTLTGLGTMAEQNANAVAITGGTISGVTIPASNVTGTLGVPNGGTGATTLTGYVKGTGTTAMTAASTIPNTDITGLGTASTKDAGVANGVATLDGTGKVPVSELPAAVLGALSYQGTWDASTNTPTLTSSVGTKGYYYVVSVAGSTNLNGITDWQVGDWAVYSGTVWQKVDNTDAGGDVVGPASATDNAITRFDGTTGRVIQNSVVTVSDTGAVAGVLSLTDPNFVDFNTAYTTPVTQGQLGWDGTFNSLAIGMVGNNVIQHIGEDTYIYVKASSAITKGQVIMFTGSVGASGVVTAAPATGVTNGQVIIGVAAETIALNGFGLIQTYGELRNVNTSTFADGDILYYNSAVTGGFTTTFPATGVIVTVAAVVNGGSAGGGVIQIRVSVTQRLTASTGISVSQTSAGTTITNTLPSLGGTVTSVSGTAGRITSTGGTTPVIDLASGVATAGTTGSSTLIPVVTIDTYGRVTSITTAANPQGTVTSVTGTSPVVSSGGATPAISLAASYGDTQNPYASKTANFVLAAPNGAAGVPTFRAVVAADIPTLNQNTTGTASNVTGTVAIANGGTGATTAPAARTALGATTVGGNMFTLTNPSAITFPRFNADNTVSALDAATFRAAIGAGTGSGTVTSVAASVPAFLSVSGSPITTSGTLAISYSGTALPLANGGTGATSAPAALTNLRGWTTTATAAGTTTLTNTSTTQQEFTGTLAQTVVLPVTSTLALGWAFEIINNSTGSLTIQSSGLNTIATLTAGTTASVICVLTSGTTAASWDFDIDGFASETGTGSVVRATSPTLVTPALGTPASGVVTNLTGTASININGTVGATTVNTGAFTTLSASGLITSTVGGQAINLNGATSNRIDWNANGAAAPTFTTRSAGTKLVLYPAIGAASGDYGFGIESGALWSSTDTTAAQFKWYGGTTLAASLTGTGNLTAVGTVQGTRLISTVATGTAPLTVTSTTQVANLNAATAGTAAGLSATLVATSGGTGQSTYTVGDLLVGGATNTLNKLADVATGNALISGGVGVAPSYGKIGLTTHVSGTLPTANGGTNLTSFTTNGLLYATSTSALTTGTTLTFDGSVLSATASAAAAVEGFFTNTNTGITASAGVRAIANSTGYYLLRQYGTGVTATVFGQTLANYALLLSDGASSNGLMIGSNTADPVIIGTNNAERMRIFSTGGVSVGNTTDRGAGALSVTSGIYAESTGPFMLNATTVSANFTIPASFNATSAGPITVNTGVTVTVSTGSTWVVV